ncbi:DUF4199 domain-containing protein [Chryseosolibacter indicus]|uniref:DUF4199 family protein n=1 Tax=Chryseosolibacter indicus TaxID=2782351 RepID=A0ABS5VP11_9BACT|nr:DUF4199 domain-containing protein [Chryseosolibacter indicus]MBT1703182.1 DUF4199 family protein [Chryseosolibacter indicus]
MESQTTTPTPTITTRSAGTRYGVIGGLVSIVFFLFLSLAGLIGTGYWNWLGYLITAVIIFMAHKFFKENGDGFMSYGQGVGISLWIGIISAAISSVFSYIYMKFIDSSFTETIKQKQIESMQERGMSDEQIDQAMQYASMFTTPEAMFIFGLLFGILGTIIIGLIVTIFTQKKAPETF